jgi:predicted TPR repeat methyltransferase
VQAQFGSGEGGLDILDAGCGTGLCGPLLRPLAARLIGVDLSPAMLTRARERAVYDELVQAELTTWLRQHAGAFDVIAAADVLVYFGDLRAWMAAAAASLHPGGRLVFTTERSEAEPRGFRLHPHGRYSHTQDYVEQTLLAAGLLPLLCERVQLRLEGGEPVAGTLVVAGKSPAQPRA